ncbi:DNA polymerase III subunit alpha [uncultured Eubacterium sp.]|uniref:DNA polymerase III subunit alpha n=1 Tax=uncultured Eubacterium sp. TaxID=165185 RepID=UPI0026143668|nr:DNA polymerase III subunit alpha [uncultured Eubacterium sp.]
MEKKKFFEVFQDLRLDQDISDLFEYVNVTRITANSTHTKMRIYIESSRLIEKSAIFTVRDEISRYLRAGKRIEIEIVEKYHLSEQYTRENLFQIYKESIILELNQISPIIATMFKKAPVRFEDNGKMVIDLESSIVSEARMKTLKDTIERIFANRFDMPIEVRIEKRLIDENRFAKRNARRLQNEVNVLLSKNQDIEEAEEKEKKEKPKRVRKATYSTDPDMVYGREFKFDADTKLSDVFEGTGETVVRGQIMTMEDRETRTGKFIVTMEITDFTDSIAVKLFLGDENAKKEFYGKVKKNSFVRVKGVAKYDTYDRQVEISSVEGMRLIPAFTVGEKRKDTAVDKRVELHCHTNMSDMDGVSKCGKIVRRAYEWGHKAIAITDHGVVQAFPDAWHEYCDIKKECKREGKECDFKVIYGVEAYLVDDLKDMIVNPRGQKLDDTYVVFDLETTGFSAKSDKIIEIGAVKVTNGKIVDRFSTFVNPERPIPFRIEKLTSINDNMVIDQPTIDEILPKFMEFCKGAIMVAHNADFDMSFIAHNCKEMGLECDFTIVDTVAMARYLVVGLGKYKLNNVAKALGIALDHHHRAVDDAECTALIFLKLCKMLEERGIDNLDDVNKEGKQSKNLINKLPAHHAIILVKDLVGRVNLYKLISISHIETFAKKPRILKSDYLKYCEGLMIGSACEAGELYQAILHGRPQQEVVRLAEFYDYFEVQPLGNNQFMLKTGNPEIDEKKKFTVDSIEDLKDVNRKIIELGRKFNKMTVATCDVHFLDPEDEIYRRIIQYGNGYRDADNQPPLYLRTTDEMLKEFDYLGSDVAEEIVITNPNKIADMIDNISPIHPDKCPPVLDNSEENLRKICFNRAHEIYGEDLPKIVEDRLEVELDSIIGNGYAVMYIMAQRLVWKSNEDGYLVGSRGSVGSSFAATMSGITECNPLAPHYYCEKCKSSFFEDEYRAPEGTDPKAIAEIQAVIKEERAEGGLGFDLPDMYCPHCGEKLHKDGLEIPFETFLGFGGTKEPDIDLNFSGEYQANAHAYTEVMFGKGHTFRAGTITGVADKTAFGYVKNYFDDHNIVKRTAEIDRIARGCTGIRRSTGQHPGGIVIVPRDKEIYDFTPIQKPANDMSVDTITTHFEYHAIDANLLKLDILGHDDPTMIRRLEKLTNTNVQKDVHFDDKKILSLFLSPEALGITSDDIDGCPTGTLGLPELGTDFVIQMLVDTKPTKIADLVRIAGLSHGTDVWLGNAQQLIAEGKCTISSAICTRDDIMVYLMDKGIEPQVSFDIMEHVRKGRGLLTYKDKETGEERQEEDVMREHNVPEWYIWSCKKIKYMFPKAHAAAYIMMALRVAWYKIYKPLAYYAAFFGIRAKAFNYETMCQGREKLEFFMADLKRKKANHEASKKDEDSLGDMKIVQEMYARGFEFLPIDIYTAKAHEFQIIDGKLMPSLDTIEGLGEKAADGLVDAVAAQDGPFVSKNDLREKSKLSKTVIETMSNLGLLNGMPEDSQLSIFDF